jgi:predicted acyl esterase
MYMSSIRVVAWCTFGLLLAPPGAAAPPRWPNPADEFNIQEVMVPMRDGTRLHTLILIPMRTRYLLHWAPDWRSWMITSGYIRI